MDTETKMDTEKTIALEKKRIMQTYSRPDFVIEYGKGCHVFDKKGKRYIDMVGGLATCILGHGNIEFADFVKKQIVKITNPTNLYYSEPQVLLAEKLSSLSGLDKCFFSNSGTESIEAAIKLARKHTKKPNIISANNGFHGRTLGSLSATGKDKIKKPFEPLVPGFKQVEYDNPNAMEDKITNQTAAIIVEPIQGEGGIIIPEKDYLGQIREICDRHGILMVLDEIQTGCARTGKFFAFEHSKIKPDIVCLAKGLANGIPIGVTISNDEIALSFEKGDHGSTFGGNPVACSAANFTVDFIMSKKLMENAAVQGRHLMDSLSKIGCDSIKEVRGKGLMVGIEMTQSPQQYPQQYVKESADKGLLINLTAEKVLRCLPPLTINKQIIDDSIKILSRIMEK